MDHFCESVYTMPQDVDDSSAAQDAIASDSIAFTREQRNRMAEAVAMHMRHGKKSSSHTVPQQSNMYLFNYMIPAAWDAAFSKGVPWDAKLEYFCDIFLALGLRNPNDDTVKLLIAILSACSERTLSPQDAYDQIHAFKTKM